MVTRITRMQRKKKKKTGKIHAISIDFASQIPIQEQFTPMHAASILKFNPYEIFPPFTFGKRWRGRGWSRSPPIFSDFSGARLRVFSPPLPFFLASFIQNWRKKSKGDDLPRRPSWDSSNERREIERKRGEGQESTESRTDRDGGSSDIQLDLRLHKLRIRVCSLYMSLARISIQVPSLWNRCVIQGGGRDPVSDEIEGGGIRTLLYVFSFSIPIFRDPVPRYLSISIEFPRYIENFFLLRRAVEKQRGKRCRKSGWGWIQE